MPSEARVVNPGVVAPGWRPVPAGLLAAVFAPAAVATAWIVRGAEGFRFAHPGALALCPIAVGLVAWTAFRRPADLQAALRHPRASELGRRPRGWVARSADLPIALRLLAVVAIGVALARPQTTRLNSDIEVEGIDIVIALDVSGSMQETDLTPNRLDAAKMVIERFVQRRPSDRIGLVVFAKDAYTHVPLTLDHGTFLRMLAELQVGIIDGRGTAIGNGIGVALNRLRHSDAKTKVMIVLTDGDNNSGNISPIQAARYARTLGVKIYTILAGDNDPDAPSPPEVMMGMRQKQPVNPKLLEEIASTTGGVPYLATDTQSLARNFQSILEDLEKSRLKDRGVLYGELFPRFLWLGLVPFLLEIALRLLRWRRLP